MAGLDPIAQQFNGMARELVPRWLPHGRREKGEWVALNPTRLDRSLGSFRICLEGHKAGLWADFATGDKGDLLKLAVYLGVAPSARGAFCLARACLGGGGDPAFARRQPARTSRQEQKAEAARQAERRKDTATRARKLFLACKPLNPAGGDLAAMDPVSRYLTQTRGIPMATLAPGAVRWHPDLSYWGPGRDSKPEELFSTLAMVALVIDAATANGVLGAHRTWFDVAADGRVDKTQRGAARKALGRWGGGLVPISRGEGGVRWADLARGRGEDESVVLAEGIETALTLAVAMPERRVAAALSLHNLATVRLPAVVRSVVLAVENDSGHQAEKVVAEAVAAHSAAGRRVAVARPKAGCSDFNDQLMAAGGAA